MSTTAREGEAACRASAPLRRPLVYCEPLALGQAQQLLPGRVVENVVQRAIVEGCVRWFGRDAVVQADGWFAVVRRDKPRVRSRQSPRPWIVTEIRRDSTRRNDGT